jgi:cell division protein FtsB
VQRPRRSRPTGRAAILVLVLAVLVVSYASSMRAYLEQKEHLADLRASIAESRAEIEQLEREKRRWRDPAYVEAQARQRFGWVMPGEIGFQVIGQDGEPLGGDDSLSDPDALVEASRPVWWEAAWGSVVAAGNPEEPGPDPVDRIRAPKKERKQQ